MGLLKSTGSLLAFYFKKYKAKLLKFKEENNSVEEFSIQLKNRRTHWERMRDFVSGAFLFLMSYPFHVLVYKLPEFKRNTFLRSDIWQKADYVPVFYIFVVCPLVYLLILKIDKSRHFMLWLAIVSGTYLITFIIWAVIKIKT